MQLKEKATIIHYHRHRLKEYKEGTVEALGWKAKESQQKRFEVIRQLSDFNGCSVLDVGCGYGDLKRYLDQSFSGFTYIGIDQMPEFINKAKQTYDDKPNTFFHIADFSNLIFPEVDYVIASGALGYRSKDKDFYFDMIRKMFEAAKKALAFNMLDAEHFPDHPLLVGHEQKKVVAFCETLSSKVEVSSGYLEDDFTVFIYK